MNDGGESRSLRQLRQDRTGLQRVWEWLLLDGNRLLVAGLVLAGVLALLVGAERVGWIPMARDEPAFYMFGALISGNLTLITVVVSINQLLLSRELKSPGELQSEIENVVDYRRTVEESAGRVAPVKPLGFLRLLFENTRREAQRIGGMTYGTASDEACKRVDASVTALTDHMDHMRAVLDKSNTDTFEVLAVTLTTNYAQEINELREIRWDYGDELPDSVTEALDDLIESLRRVDVARQYFKSLYLQEELSSLSRVLLYTGVPAEAITVVVLLGFTAKEATALTRYADLLLPVTVTVAFLPLALLLSYIVRTATVTQRTVATTPFTTPKQER